MPGRGEISEGGAGFRGSSLALPPSVDLSKHDAPLLSPP